MNDEGSMSLPIIILRTTMSLKNVDQKQWAKNTEPLSLLNRLTKRQEEVLEFLYQRDVPFENNQAENDKSQTKGFWYFQTPDGAEYFARIRRFYFNLSKAE